MGADLILASLVIRRDRDPKWDTGINCVRNMTSAALREKLGDSYLNSTGEDPEGPEELRDWAIAVIEEVKGIVGGSYRDTDVLTVGPYDVHITGGTSFGDNPSESFQPFVDFANMRDVPELIGFEG